jgi:hypothetical protein
VDTSAGAFKDSALNERRPRSLTADHPTLGTVTIRDQAPLRLQFLEGCLTDMSIQQWLAILNDRVFFWLHPAKLDRLLGARLYRTFEQDVLVIDTNSLLDAHGGTYGYHPSTPVRRCIRTPRPVGLTPSPRSRSIPTPAVAGPGRSSKPSRSWQ